MQNAPRDHARVRRHLEGAWQAVVKTSLRDFTARRLARRKSLLRHLREYIDAGRYPINDLSLETTPLFTDTHGNRCAVAALLESTGHHALVERVARTRNRARVHELRSELAEWLDQQGLLLEEAARIQPAYKAHLEPDWKPTVSIVAGANAAGTEAVGAEAVFTAGVRAGIRREVRGSDDNGNSQYGSLALTLGYARAVVVNRGATHELSLLLHWEPLGNHSDVQWYVLGGPVASIDDDSRPGSGFGAQLGAGFSFRRREVPLFAELVVQALPSAAPATLRAGAQVGLVW